MVRIVRATAGYPEIPIGFPILISNGMAIIEPAFAWLLDWRQSQGGACGGNYCTYAEHLHDWFDSWRNISTRLANSG